MPIDVNNFIVPEQNMGGLYKVGDTLAKENYRKRQAADDAQKEQLSSTKYLENYFDPKDYLTGSQFDPMTNKLLFKAHGQALDLIKQNVPLGEVLMATSKLVNQVNDYMQKGKMYNEQKKNTIAALKDVKGIDVNKLSNEMDNAAFPIDPKTGQRDVNQFDPNSNYADVALKNGDVYTNEGFSDYVSKAGKNTTVEDVTVQNPNKSLRRTKAEITIPSFMQKETDERGAVTGFVPKYDIATEGDTKLMHTFGEQGDHPVRIVTQEVFDSLPAEAKAYLRQEVKRHSQKLGVPITSAQAENFAKALAYDELKQSGKNYSTLKEQQVEKAAPAPKITINTGEGKSNKVNINDVYEGIKNKTADPTAGIVVKGDRIGTRFNALDADAQEIISTFVNKNRSIKLDPDELFVNEEDGKIKVYSTGGNKEIKFELRGGKYHPSETQLIYTLPERTTNLAAKQTGKEAKSAIIGKESSGGKKVYNPKTGKFE
jgi:hypothetical protein